LIHKETAKVIEPNVREASSIYEGDNSEEEPEFSSNDEEVLGGSLRTKARESWTNNPGILCFIQWEIEGKDQSEMDHFE
jgi:hypothetical protein